VRRNIINILIITTSIFFYSCHIGHDHANEEHNDEEHLNPKGQGVNEKGDHHEEQENKNTTMLTFDQMKSIKIKMGKLEKKQLTSSLKANGLLRVPNDCKASVTALMGGVIKTLPIQIGNFVRKGQTIATIYNTTFIALQENFLNTSLEIEFATLEYERQKTLKEGNATAIKAFQQAESTLKLLQVKKSSLQKQLELIGFNTASLNKESIQSVLSVRSPINGIVSNISVNLGSYTDTNSSIAQIVDNNQLHLDLYIYEKDLQKLNVGQTIHFTQTNNPGKEYDAKVYAISNTFEENTKSIAVHCKVLGDKKGLIEGMNITALVSLEKANVDAVPTDAIVNHEGQDFIFIMNEEQSIDEHNEESKDAYQKHEGNEQAQNEKVQANLIKDDHKHEKEGKTFEKIPIRKGTTDVGYSEITLLKEIPINSKIVINGAFFILAKMNNKGEAHQH
jgi:RND family efflux transporter MFP subunit